MFPLLFPPRPEFPQLARLAGGFCRCRCHDVHEGDVLSASQRIGAALAPFVSASGLGSIAVAVTRVDEAAVACDRCRDGHCPALSGRPAELERPRWNPPEAVEPQADGDSGPCGAPMGSD